MSRIERYLAGGIVRPIIGVFLALLAVVLVFYASRALARAAAEELPFMVVVLFTAMRLGIFMDVLLPVAMFLGVVLGLGRLQASYEIVAMAAVGTGLSRILRATLVPALLVAVIVGVFSLAIRPWAYATVYSVEADLAVRLDLSLIETGRFQALNDEWLVFAEGRRDGVLENVLVRQRSRTFDSLLRARQLHQEIGEDGERLLVFSDGVHAYRFDAVGALQSAGRFERLSVAFTAPPPPTRDRLRRALPTRTLWHSDEPIEVAELQWRLHSPVAAIVLAFAAVPLSRINPRHGQSARLLGAALFVTVYFSVLGVLTNWLEQGRLAMWPGVFWLPIVVIGALWLRYWLVQRRPGAPL